MGSCFFTLPGRNATLAVKYQNRLCISRSFAVSLREGFFLLKKKRIAKLSMLCHPSEYSVSHRSVIYTHLVMSIRIFIHTFVRTYIQKQNAFLGFGSEFIHYTLSYLVCFQCIQSKGQGSNHQEYINIYTYSIG